VKQKDIVLIIVVVFIGATSAFLFSKYVINTAKVKKQKVEVVGKIDKEFIEPDKKYFNKNSINPTKVITIGQGPNNKLTIGDKTQ